MLGVCLTTITVPTEPGVAQETHFSVSRYQLQCATSRAKGAMSLRFPPQGFHEQTYIGVPPRHHSNFMADLSPPPGDSGEVGAGIEGGWGLRNHRNFLAQLR